MNKCLLIFLSFFFNYDSGKILPLWHNSFEKYPGLKRGSILAILQNKTTSQNQSTAIVYGRIMLEGMINKWLFTYTNSYRKQNGVAELAVSTCLNAGARYHASYLCNTSLQQKKFILMHEEDSNSVWFKGFDPTARAAKAGCKISCGENALCTGLQVFQASDFKDRKKLEITAQEIARNMVYNIWHHSKGHRQNMLSKQYNFLGTSVITIKQNFNICNNDNEDKFIYLVAFAIQVFGY